MEETEFEQKAESETFLTEFICDHCGQVGRIEMTLNGEIDNYSCPKCSKKRTLLLNFNEEKGFVIGSFKVRGRNGSSFINPTFIRDDILKSFSLLTFENTVYKFNRINKTYENAEMWLNKLIQEVLGEDSKERMIKEVVSQIKIYTGISEYPAPDPMCIPFNNGIYELESGNFRDYAATDYFFYHLPINYSPIPCPKIDSFFESVVDTPRERQWLIDWASFVFARKIFTSKMLLITGYGSNGKSIYADILRSALGEKLHTSISLHDLHDFGLEPLYVQRPYLNTSGELSSKKDLEQDIIKKLVSGESVTLNRKNKSFVTFESKTKFLALSNELPENLRDLSDGWCRRILPMNFDKQFAEDENFRKEVTNVNEVGGWVSSVIIPNLRELLQTRKITDALSNEEVRSFFNENMNSISAFCEECLEYDINSRMESGVLQAAYLAYCSQQKIKRSSNIALGKGLKRFFRAKLRVKWNDPAPIELVTARSAGGQETFTEAYKGIKFKGS